MNAAFDAELAGKRSTLPIERAITIFLVGDILMAVITQLVAFWLRFETPLVNYGVARDPSVGLRAYFGHFVIGAVSLIIVLFDSGFYRKGNVMSLRLSGGALLKSCAIWMVGFLGLSLVLKFNPSISRLYCFVAGGCALVLLAAWRSFALWLVRGGVFGQLRKTRFAFLGWDEECTRALEASASGSGGGLDVEIAGVILPPLGELGAAPPPGIPVLGGFEKAEELMVDGGIDALLVTDLDLQRREMISLSNLCEREMIDFKLVPNCFQGLLSGLHMESAFGLPVLGVSKLPLHSIAGNYVKRLIDILGGIVGLVISAPLIAYFGFRVWKEDCGPIFYRQTRMGKDGTSFEIIKLRSMKLNAESASGAVWAQEDDPRRLAVGAFMRAWNIDEVPQFWNVIKGEMSLVGPRPERPELIEGFKGEIPHYNVRHNIKPGLTGWAQVNGLRGNTCLSDRIRFDLHYIENWNLLLDFQIMFMTLFKRENAY